jgi:hypothetical protein
MPWGSNGPVAFLVRVDHFENILRPHQVLAVRKSGRNMNPIHILTLCCLLLSACAEKEAVPRSVLIVAPHPDDETLGCGGQIALLSKEGCTVHFLVLTDGSQLFVSRFGSDSQPPPAEISSRRKRETERTVAHLGGDPTDIRYLDFGDGKTDRDFLFGPAAPESRLAGGWRGSSRGNHCHGFTGSSPSPPQDR